jgi:hypothetical protein
LEDCAGFAFFNGVRFDDAQGSLDGHLLLPCAPIPALLGIYQCAVTSFHSSLASEH